MEYTPFLLSQPRYKYKKTDLQASLESRFLDVLTLAV